MKNFFIMIVGIFALILSGCASQNRERFAGQKLTYKTGGIEIVVQAVSPAEVPVISDFEWIELSDELLHSATSVVVGSISDIQEISMTYEYMGQEVTDYWSLLSLTVQKTIRNENEIKQGSDISVLFELSSHRAEEGIQVEKGKAYIFYLKQTSEVTGILDYSPIADYLYCIPANNFIPISEPQNPELLACIGAEEGLVGDHFVNALEKYYE